MNSVPAQYLLRFDDLCPTMDRHRWQPFAQLIRTFHIQPILAIVPDNQDPELIRDPPDSGFWEEMRSFQSTGAAIGLHGFQHRCQSTGRSLIPLHSQTEFAGASAALQQEWIGHGLSILRSHGLEPSIWVAPRHGTDQQTLSALRSHNLNVISDGFARSPFLDHGQLWIPQQLWSPVAKPSGIWTICLHANSASGELIARLQAFVSAHAAQFTCVQAIVASHPTRPRTLADRLFHQQFLTRMRISRIKRRLLPA